ncbi:hypothetical protein F2Q69_00016459 [Brassica cretica]|uniref:Uncharacterized protein n=1 Tax=Brassica cretica TaxID=69181 RepID=A0A8S9QH29_BRACR|nr:hypothetical protein F2Q69_00016459 [Brassica cretica]
MASPPEVVEHYKRKFYLRYMDPDLVVEPMSSNLSSSYHPRLLRLLMQMNNKLVRGTLLITVLCRALEQVAKFLRRNFTRSTIYSKYLEDPCVWVESNTTTLNILSSQAEIAIGFLLIISLFSYALSSFQK